MILATPHHGQEMLPDLFLVGTIDELYFRFQSGRAVPARIACTKRYGRGPRSVAGRSALIFRSPRAEGFAPNYGKAARNASGVITGIDAQAKSPTFRETMIEAAPAIADMT